MDLIKSVLYHAIQMKESKTAREWTSEIEICLNVLNEKLDRIAGLLEPADETFAFFRDGLFDYKERQFKHLKVSQAPLATWFTLIQQDNDLRWPHRKLLDVLLRNYDYQSGQFIEVQFSGLVREARVGKNAAKSYLSFLMEKRYIIMRHDGYRKFYRMTQPNSWILASPTQ